MFQLVIMRFHFYTFEKVTYWRNVQMFFTMSYWEHFLRKSFGYSLSVSFRNSRVSFLSFEICITFKFYSKGVISANGLTVRQINLTPDLKNSGWVFCSYAKESWLILTHRFLQDRSLTLQLKSGAWRTGRHRSLWTPSSIIYGAEEGWGEREYGAGDQWTISRLRVSWRSFRSNVNSKLSNNHPISMLW